MFRGAQYCNGPFTRHLACLRVSNSELLRFRLYSADAERVAEASFSLGECQVPPIKQNRHDGGCAAMAKKMIKPERTLVFSFGLTSCKALCFSRTGKQPEQTLTMQGPHAKSIVTTARRQIAKSGADAIMKLRVATQTQQARASICVLRFLSEHPAHQPRLCKT